MPSSGTSDVQSGHLKRDLRRELLARRAALPAADRARWSEAIAARLAARPEFLRARTIALYAPLGAEVDTGPVAALAAGRVLVYPIVLETARALAFARCAPGALVAGALGAPAPSSEAPRVALETIDLVVVPGVGFDARGLRLGRGRGHYDATLAALPARAARVALAFEAQLVPEVPCEPHDAPLDLVVTEARVIAPAAPGTR